MEPKIVALHEKKLIGIRLNMSFAQNRTFEMWRSFMPRRKEIINSVGTDLYSVQIYPKMFFNNFDPGVEFEKWAATEVTDFDSVPEGMETLTVPDGLYAVFHYKGAPSAAGSTYQYIHATWLPNSEYSLDCRPHFDVLGEKYKNENPDSEEDLWIPIRLK